VRFAASTFGTRKKSKSKGIWVMDLAIAIGFSGE